jgi:hypothetical protein
MLNNPIIRHFCRPSTRQKPPLPIANSFIQNSNPQTHPGIISIGANGVGQGGWILLEQDSKPNRQVLPFTSLCKRTLLAAGRRRGLWFQSTFVAITMMQTGLIAIAKMALLRIIA